MVAKKIVVTEPVEEKPVVEAASAETTALADNLDAVKEPAPAEPQPNSPESSEPTQTPPDSESSNRPASKPETPSRLTFPASSTRSLPKGTKRRRWAVVLVGLVVIIVIVAAVVAHILTKPAGNPLPKSLQQEANFTLYYPHSSVGKYKYVTGSGNYADGKLTYNLGGAGGPIIHISEQALTVKAPDLHELQGFSVFQTSVGQAAVGASGNVLNGVVIAPKTLIILNGLGGVSKQDFTQTIKNLGS